MAKSYDKMTLAELQETLRQKAEGMLSRIGATPGQAAGSAPMPPEPPITDMPLAEARKAAASKAAL